MGRRLPKRPEVRTRPATCIVDECIAAWRAMPRVPSDTPMALKRTAQLKEQLD
jgi:hypothetical protein